MFEADSTPRESGAIRKVLSSLDAATKEFTQRLDELSALGSSPRGNGSGRVGRARKVSSAPPIAPEVAGPVAPKVASTPSIEPSAQLPRQPRQSPPRPEVERRQLDLDRRMADADAEAKRYLEQAKQRADAMVQSIVGAVEAEADSMRRDAEQQIRARWQQVEADAEGFLVDARRVADGLVADRQRRISDVSDTIVGLAEGLSERMHDADRIRHQFESLVATLSETSQELAAAPASVAEPRATPLSEAPAEPATDATQEAVAEMWWRNATRGHDVEPRAHAA